MKHIIEKLELWLAGELSAAEVAEVEQHLVSCPECATRAQELRQVWDILGTVDESRSVESSIWPAVRSRTVGQGEERLGSGWLFGGGPTLRAGLAATAVAAGLALAFILPAGQQSSNSGNIVASLDEISDMEWLAESTIFSSDSGGLLDDLWQGTGLDNEGDGS